MMKKIVLVAAASVAAILGTVGLVRNSKGFKMRRMVKRVGAAMYNAGTMLRVLSMQTVSR